MISHLRSLSKSNNFYFKFLHCNRTWSVTFISSTCINLNMIGLRIENWCILTVPFTKIWMSQAKRNFVIQFYYALQLFFRYAMRSLRSCGFLIPAKTILVPCDLIIINATIKLVKVIDAWKRRWIIAYSKWNSAFEYIAAMIFNCALPDMYI